MRARQLLFHALLLAAILAGLALFSRWPARSAASAQAMTSAKQPVIVELFTSEGCSSCPPADSLLAKLSEDQPFDRIEIIPLEEHVDYWNNLGWTDPFSSSAFSRRQQDYANLIPGSGVYTPQIVVDGRAQFVGSRTDEAREQIRWAASQPKSRLLLLPTSSPNARTRAFELRLDPSTPSPSSSPLELWVAITEKGLHSDVTAGENSGETLQHAPVVRQLRKLQSLSLPLNAPLTFTLNIRDNWNPANLTVVAFLVQPRSRQILAGGSSPFTPSRPS
jgi:hypothetical protein